MNNHILYKTGDAGVPEQIQDQNGEVALSCCKICGKAEIELSEPCFAKLPSEDAIQSSGKDDGCYPAELVAKAKFEIQIFERVSRTTG